MSALLECIAALARCNHHAVLYGAFGVTLLLRGLLALREHGRDEAREDMMHGLVLCLLAIP